jgi:hypothetical protein
MISRAHCTDAAISLSVLGLPLRTTKQIVGGAHVQAGHDRGHDADDALTAFVHAGGLSCSLLLRQ